MSTHRERVEQLSDQEHADKFGEYLAELVDTLKAEHGWNTSEVIKRGGTGRTTFYRWLNGSLKYGMPKVQMVRDFHRHLGLDPEHALRILGFTDLPGGALPPDAVRVPDPEIRDYVRSIVIRLDGATSEAERYHYRATLAQLAGAPAPSAQRPPSENQRRRNQASG